MQTAIRQELWDNLTAKWNMMARRSMSNFSKATSDRDEWPAEHHELLCDCLDKVLTGEIPNLMVFMPPGSAKSTYATVKFPAYVIGRWDAAGDAGKGIISGSYNQDLANVFGRKVRNLVKSQEYQQVFEGTTLSLDSQSKAEWETALGNNYKSVGVDAGLTGRRGDLGVIDDPVKGRKAADSELIQENTYQWYKTEFLTRLKPNSPQIMILTRWTENDLPGRILPESWDGESGTVIARDGKEWYVVCLPAEARENDILGRSEGAWLWEEWFTPQWWEQTKRTMTLTGMRDWNSLYQQTPTAEEGTFFKREWFKRYNLEDAPTCHKYITQDNAVSADEGDFTEFGTWGLSPAQDLYALDWWFGQETPDLWVDALLDMVEEHKPLTVFGEKGVIAKATEPFLLKRSSERRVYADFQWLARTSDKAASAQSFRARAAMGKVYIPHTVWGDRLINQLCGFPGARYDDAVDNCSLIGMAIDQVIALSGVKEPAPQRKSRYDKAFDEDDDDGDNWKVA